MATFADRLRQLRIEKHMSQKVLSDNLGISRQTVSFYESGDRVPDIYFTLRIAKYFNVTTDYLIGYTDTKAPSYEGAFIQEQTGLSEEAVTLLRNPNYIISNGNQVFRDIISKMITNDEFHMLFLFINNFIKFSEKDKNTSGDDIIEHILFELKNIDRVDNIIDNTTLMTLWKFKSEEQFKKLIENMASQK